MGKDEKRVQGVTMGLLLLGVGFGGLGCNGSSQGLSDTGSAAPPSSTATSPASGSSSGGSSPGKPDAATHEDAGGMPSGDDAGDASPAPVDASMMPVKPGSDAACEAPLGWWATDAAFDANVMAASFTSAVNPMLAGQHPITIADYEDANQVWTMRVSATRTNGNYQQYFPFDHASDVAPMARQMAGFASGSPANSAWIVVVDLSQTPVWIAISNATVSASYVDAYCQDLSGGELDAVIPASAGSTSITTAQGSTTLRDMLGAHTSQVPPGWTLRLQFDGQKVDVSSK
jgi:hypothetical protein